MTQSDHGRHRGGRRSNSTQRRMAVALLVVAVVGSAAATAWAVTENARSNPSAGNSEPTVAAAGDNKATADPEKAKETPGAAVPRVATTTAPTPPAELVACEEAVAGADQAVQASESGVTHWGEHVQARTDLLAGAITLEDTSAIFKRTRLAGPEDLTAFDEANEEYLAVESGCAELDPDQVSTEWQEAAQACVDRQPVMAEAVDAAAAAIDDWRSHQANMRQHASGDMSATMAQQEWIEAWTNAPPNLDAYQDAIEQLSEAPACDL